MRGTEQFDGDFAHNYRDWTIDGLGAQRGGPGNLRGLDSHSQGDWTLGSLGGGGASYTITGGLSSTIRPTAQFGRLGAQ